MRAAKKTKKPGRRRNRRGEKLVRARRASDPSPPPRDPATLDFAALWKLLPGGYDPVATAEGSWFDPVKAQLACDFFPEMLVHVEGALAGQPFVLEPWQQAIVACIFGWQVLDEKGRTVRRFREAFMYVPRKNGKTPLAAGICLYLLFCDGEAGAQIYSAAADTEQAAYLFRQSRGMVAANPHLAGRSKVYGGVNHRSIVLTSDIASVYRVLSAEADTKHGGNSHAIIIDELHAQKNRELVDVLVTSMASANRAQPLIIFITTADFKRKSICNEKLDYARKVRDGLIKNYRFLPVIYEVLDSEDWTDPKIWARVNPNLGVSVSYEYLAAECKRAVDTPAYQNTFKRLHLNLQTDADVVWIDVAKWDACLAQFTEEQLAGRACYGGLDLSKNHDLSNFSLIFPPVVDAEDELGKFWALLQWFFVPQENAHRREQRDRVPYIQWIKERHLIPTEGDVTDYEFIKVAILGCCQRFDVKGIGFDPWQATQLAIQLDQATGRTPTRESTEDGMKVVPGLMVEFPQHIKSMAKPTEDLTTLILSAKLRQNGNPVMRWNVSNTVVYVDANGNQKPAKNKSTERIDGVVGTVMAIGMANSDSTAGPSVYDDPGAVI